MQEAQGNAQIQVSPVNPVAILNTPFVQLALLLEVTLTIAAWWNNKRVDDLDDLWGCHSCRRFTLISFRIRHAHETTGDQGSLAMRLLVRKIGTARHDIFKQS